MHSKQINKCHYPEESSDFTTYVVRRLISSPQLISTNCILRARESRMHMFEIKISMRYTEHLCSRALCVSQSTLFIGNYSTSYPLSTYSDRH